jgi:hypothetical protein
MSGEEKKTSISSSVVEEEERKERIIKLKKEIDNDAEMIEQIKDDIAKIDNNDLKKSLNSTKVALEKEKKMNEEILKNMKGTLLQQRHAEVQKARKEANVYDKAFLSTFAQHLYPKVKKKAEEESKDRKKAAAAVRRATNPTKRKTRKWFGGKRKTKRRKRTRRKKRTKRRRRSKKRRTRRRKTKRRRGGVLEATEASTSMQGGRKKRGGTGSSGPRVEMTGASQVPHQ